MHGLEIINVHKAYGPVEVLKSINITIDPGEFLVLLGPSGCGKSTLLSMIAGLEAITDGEIRIEGVRVNDLPPKDRDIAMVFQSYALYPTMTVRQNMEFGLKVRKLPRKEREAAIGRVAELLQIGALLDRKPSQLSGGQRQRVAMGRALVRDPKLFLFDEPLSNLDAKLRVDMRTEIKRLHRRLGTTVVYVTHDQVEAMTMATKVAIMRDGVLQQIARPETIYDFPTNTYVAQFIGSPAMNILPARCRLLDGRVVADVRGKDGEAWSVAGIAISDEMAKAYDGKDVLVGIRPETIGLAANENARQLTPFSIVIDVVEPTGPDVLAIFSFGGQEVIARLPARSVEAGQTVTLVADPEKTILFDETTQRRIE